ncbi:MAG: 2-amino-4-hydroxy-6-hydroxymethyldihydropteridine diphosphokinase [Rickettsiales bacterium]|nr:2-amino-4-hydroxy-6-hydroxymethyldihydropteridine diphosphokinase [Rickettsiales bacterium]
MDNFILIALGSNLLDREKNIKSAIEKLSKIVDVERVSSLYKSDAFIPKNSPEEWNKPFLNCVLAGRTNLGPQELLLKTKEIEREINTIARNKGTSEPRMLDVDIIAFNQEIINDDNLQIPHPRMCERNFVIYPIAEILPNWVFYGEGENHNKSALELTKNLPKIEKNS